MIYKKSFQVQSLLDVTPKQENGTLTEVDQLNSRVGLRVWPCGLKPGSTVRSPRASHVALESLSSFLICKPGKRWYLP